jgi:hypothetical protein
MIQNHCLKDRKSQKCPRIIQDMSFGFIKKWEKRCGDRYLQKLSMRKYLGRFMADSI